MFLNLLQRLAFRLIAEESDVNDTAEADGGEDPEHPGLCDGVHQWCEGESHQEG